ncbi:nucleotidyl transferase AbiEii/AbiGii toxin family protein [Kitasatospora sp. NPDC015120]|uniref:nucleotidyl transferase AbiEii/AbiGii toxin family protein n=1 Tax=Kitasatospora sp. NPDC015120 TaxID=3364023 RepID=UPI0036F491B1
MSKERPLVWEDLDYGPWQGLSLPGQPPPEDVREERDLPRSILPIADEAVHQQPVFDPALAGYARALRPSEPVFTDPGLAGRWLAARREALNTVLSAVAASPWAEHLVLRGSILLRAWYGEQAREPGDLDFVVQPTDWPLEDERTGRMLTELAAGAEALCGGAHGDEARPGRVRLHADRAVDDDIWTYGRVPGRRLVLPWTAPGLPGGTVQLDFVFTEHLPAAPEPCELPGVEGPLLAATPALSLAWKILWLVSDSHPQGKDLYDAVLLSRTARVSYALLREVFVRSEEHYARWPVLPGHIADADVDWDEFAKDHPGLAGPVDDYPAELLAGLSTTFGGRGEYALRAEWLAPVIGELREVLAHEGMAAVQRWITTHHMPPSNALVVVRELLDGDLAAARKLLGDHGHPNRHLNDLPAVADRYAAELAAGRTV